MCGIVGAITAKTELEKGDHSVTPLLLEWIQRLEYRGYDSAGIAVLDSENSIKRVRAEGKVKNLEELINSSTLSGTIGIAHTRWATHGVPATSNAHPHIANSRAAVVHNGIIENHQQLREEQKKLGFKFTSETDSETVVHQIEFHLQNGSSLSDAVWSATTKLRGAYALGVISPLEPELLVAARLGSPLVIGVGSNGNYIASDSAALISHTNKFIYLEDGDLAEIRENSIKIFNRERKAVERKIHTSSLSVDDTNLGRYAHYMLKEIYEQPNAIAETLEGRIADDKVLEESFGPSVSELFDKIQAIQILACGTSYHAGMVARNWFEGVAGVPCHVEVASEYRYRHPVVLPGTLIVTISQSGETADTLAALNSVKNSSLKNIIGSLAICNVAESSLIRESDFNLLTRAGPEIGVASTKAFTTQLTALLMLVTVVGRRFNITDKIENRIVTQLTSLSRFVESALTLEDEIKELAKRIVDHPSAIFLGRGVQYPVALEGALKLKEISYIHAEAYPSGELKHGPLALVDEDMPIITVAPNDDLLEKVKSNLAEVRSRNGQLIIFADHDANMGRSSDGYSITIVPPAGDHVSPIQFSIPLQLLAYHVALLKGTDIDQPRNLAKSVTVE
ncbi:MAG: glutamine--fructose-6-phosphate transaminase (isomerizing) [Thiotrichales bacterium]|nr:glutamine--fructose-6-phosphate transaminase (isomerizing) [Thiotrichales bacterium]